MPRRKQQAPRRASAYIDDDEFAEDCAHEEESGEASEDDPRVPSPSQGLEQQQQQQEQQEHEPLALRALTQTRDNRCGNVDSNGNHHLVQGSDDEGDNNNDVDDDDDGGGGGGDDDEGMNNHSHNHNHHHHHHHRSRSSNSSSSNNKTKNGISSQMNNSGSSNNANGGNGNDIDDDDDDDDDGGGGEMEEEAEEEEEEMVDDDGDVDDDRGVALEKETTAAAATDGGVGAPPAKSAPHFCSGSSSNGQTDSDKAGRRRAAKLEEEAAATTPTTNAEEEEEDKKKDPVSPSVIEDSLSQMKAAYANFLSSSYWSTVGSFSYAQPNGAGGGGAGANFDWHRAAVAKSLQQATSPSTPSPLYAHDQQCGLFSSVQLYRQSSKLYSPVFTGASKFRCRDCSAAYDRLVDLTVHMSETGHYRDESMRAANGGADGSGNRQAWSKPRKRSLMEIEGKEEAQKVLRCLCCGHAFESLQDLSVHMIRTKHYQKVPLREPMAALTAKPCHATKKRPHLETTAAAAVVAAAERACSSPESTVSDAAATPPADQLSGNHKGQVAGPNCPARSSSTTANTTTTTSSSSSHHHHHHHQNGTSYSWQFESQKAHILKCMECGSSHDTLQQLTAHMMATGHFIKLTAPANSSSSSSLLLARKSKQVNFEAHAADDKVQSVHLGATSKLGAVPPPAVAAVKVERQSARDGNRHAGAEGKKANVKDKKSEQREKRETSAAAAEKGVTSPSPDLPKHQEADLPSQFDYLKEEDLSESSKEGGLDILKSLEHTVASIISKAQNGSGSWGGYPSIHAAYQLPGHVARPAHAPSVAPSKLVTRDDLELQQQQQRQQHRHHHRRQQPSPPPSRSHVESSSSSPSSSAATTPSPPASPHGAKVPPLVPSPPVQPLPSNVRAMEELVRKMTEKVNSSSAPSSSSSPFSAASSSRMTRDASESKGAPPRTAAAVVAGKREARDDKGHAAARGAELFGGRDVKWDLGQELRRKASHEARRGAGARDARERHGREAQRLGGGGGGERLRDVKVERTIEVKSEATRGASPPAGVEASAVCLKVEGAQGAGRRDGSCTAAANAAEVAVAATGGANKTCEARNGKSADEKPFSSSSSSSSSCTPPGFSSLSIITEHPGEPCLVNPLSALQSVMNAHLGKAAKPLSPALLDPLSRLHRLGGSSLDRPRSAAATATALPASLGHARHADGAAGGDERAPSFAARGEPSSDQPMDLTKSKPASAAAERCRAGGSVAAMPLMLAASPAGENALSDISDLVRNLAGRLTPKPPTPSSATSSVAASDRSDGGDACGGSAPDEDAAEAERGPPGGAGGGSAASADVSGKQRKAGRQSAWNPRHLLLLQAQFAASLRQTADGRYVISDLSPQERLNVARATGLSASTISHWLANVKYQLRRTGGTKFLKHMDTGRPVFYCCDCAMQFRTPPAYVGHAEAHLGFGLRDLSKVAVVERTGAEGLAVGSQQAASPSPPPPSVAAAAVTATAAAAAAAGPRDEPECGAPCRCQLCGRSFSSRHAVKLHLSKAHSKSPEDHVMFVSDVAADQPAPQPQA